MVTKSRNDLSLRIPLTAEEQDKFREYVEDNAINMGRFVKKLILDAIEKQKEAN